jgi:hypothetical protein
MKKYQKQFSLFNFSILFIVVVIACAWQNPNNNNSVNQFNNIDQTDTVPKNNYNKEYFNSDEFNKAMKELDKSMDNLDIQMKNLDVNIDKQVEESLSKINFDEIEKQTEASLKAIDWNKMQQQVDNSMKNAQQAIAKIDFTKMQNQMKDLQEKFQSQEFKSQFDSEKLHKQIDDAMSKAKEGIEKAKEKLQQMKEFTNALTADGLIDKKKGYTIEWKDGDLIINGKEQPKSISNKYRKYESDGKIKMLPNDAEHL